MGWLALMFIVVPVVELALLIKLGGLLGFVPTLALIILTGVIGARLAKQQGLNVLQRIQTETQAGRIPGDALIDGAIILFAGALLLTPGVITDVVGFLGLLPPARNAIKRSIRASMKRALERGDLRVQTFVVHGRPPPGYPQRPADQRRPLDGRGPVIDVTPPKDETPERAKDGTSDR